MAATVLRVRAAPPTLRLRGSEWLLIDRDAHVEVELAPQVAEARVDLLVLGILVAIERLSMAEATVTLAAREAAPATAELLRPRLLSCCSILWRRRRLRWLAILGHVVVLCSDSS